MSASTLSCGHGGTTWSFVPTGALCRIRSRMKRSSTITSLDCRSVCRFIQSNIRATSDRAESRPDATIWSGLMSITHHTRGTRRSHDTRQPPNPANGGLVLTRIAVAPGVTSARSNAWAMKSTCATSRTAIEPLPKLDHGSLRTCTPARSSRRGYRRLGSSYPRAAVHTFTCQPRRTISSATSASCWPTAAGSGG